MPEPKAQRIKMRIYKHAVKLDGTVTEYAPDGSTFVVQFDGPLGEKRFWQYSETLVTDLESDKSASGSITPAAGAQIWEVL